MSDIFDERQCFLGEGPLWHPERKQLFWFDIINSQLLTRERGAEKSWTFDEMVSAAGWIDHEHLLVSGETALYRFNVETGNSEIVGKLSLGDGRRTNDGRADPWGGFWFSSMSKSAEAEAGAIYRYYRGEIHKLFSNVTIPNAICFSPERRLGYFADTARKIIKKVALDAQTGLPTGAPEVFADLMDEGLSPDGSSVDVAGNMWNAQWSSGRVAVYNPEGELIETVTIDAPHTSCPAFGGPDYSTLYCTTAQEGLDAEALKKHPRSGMVFSVEGVGRGGPEPRVVL